MFSNTALLAFPIVYGVTRGNETWGVAEGELESGS
jgi:hypothetical protein